ncbi:hypothetical protein RSW31_25230, partial [Escherichia coli]|uniref:histidine kinase dimerization/phospho-acceptor domain-containing protein n=1 Tax=Escherichia coli TaxID=562 RepID=UPI0028DDEFE1
MDGFSNIIQRRYANELPDEAVRYLELIRENTKDMSKLVENLLLLSRTTRQELRKQIIEPLPMAR